MKISRRTIILQSAIDKKDNIKGNDNIDKNNIVKKNEL